MSAADHEAKIRRVPRAWAADPDGWWAHVEACDACTARYERPDPVPWTSASADPLGDAMRLAHGEGFALDHRPPGRSDGSAV